MEDAIILVLSNMTVTLLVVGLVVASILALASKRRRERGYVSGAFVNQFLLFSVAIGYLYNFVVHSFFGDFIAKEIGWEQSPFQLEVAFASLGFSLVGFVAFPRQRGLLVKFVALLGPAVFLWGAAGGHIYDIIMSSNLAPGNAGSILYTDIGLPIVGFAFMWWHAAAMRNATDSAQAKSPSPM